MGGKANEKPNFYIKLYYEFGGSSDWLKEEIIKKRFDSFRYLMPTNNKEKANVIIEIYSNENSDNKYLTITSFTKFIGIVTFPKIVFKDYKISSCEMNSMYTYLKETYFEK